ncbi:HD domain-containing protein [Rufibacter psychrotolerans]|uniref:HD domain-containing protein n=1 Tax=Rufibacter psychrotolerans TaxID=2812556 RepID=UPI001967B12F|nr:HD domain-containing protein [Rufibacter sp. SYSU D00308]
MPSISFEQLQQHVVEKLRAGLAPHLTYHGVHHTLDVLQQATCIAQAEGITAEQELLLLKTAALYHDTGFLLTYQQHEESSCALARQELPGFGFTPQEIETVCCLIMATKVPQAPQTKLQEILCDADLDYLGRPDFYEIGATLYQEFLHYGIVQEEADWHRVQLRFLESHRYFTRFSKNNRETQKQQHLTNLRAEGITQR